MTNVDVSQAVYTVEAAIAGRAAAAGIPPPRTVRPPYVLGENWPPDYGLVHAWRRQQLARFEQDAKEAREEGRENTLLDDAKAWYAGKDLPAGSPPDAYAERAVAFLNHWADTYDPRLIGTGRQPKMPFVLFLRQEELVRFLYACILGDAPGVVEKSRDMGATWVAGGVSVKEWCFAPGFVAGWGSNKAEQVDVLGNPKSIFEKLRMLILGLTPSLRPDVVEGVHLKQHTCRNPDNGAVIDGEIGKNIGRGGRSRVYFVDEAAHLEHPEAVEASLSENTRCRIDMSSVSQPGTVFHSKRLAAREWAPGDPVVQDRANLFVLDWSDHPEKTREWYARRRAYFAAQGTPSVVAREIDRDYMGAAEGVIIAREWAEAAVDAHLKLGFDDSGGWSAGLDLADEGRDKNALVRARGVVIRYAEEIDDRDPGAVARRAFRVCRTTSPIVMQYDTGGGFGGSVKSEFNRIGQDEGVDVSWLTLVPWNAAAAVRDPGLPIIPGDRNAPTNKNFFQNFKAQAWWNVGRMFYRTWQAVTGEAEYPPDQLVSIASAEIPEAVLVKLIRELCQATMGQSAATLKLVVDKAPEGMKSPNLGDGTVMCRYPASGPVKTPVSAYVPKVFTG